MDEGGDADLVRVVEVRVAERGKYTAEQSSSTLQDLHSLDESLPSNSSSGFLRRKRGISAPASETRTREGCADLAASAQDASASASQFPERHGTHK